MLKETLKVAYFTIYEGTSKDVLSYDDKLIPDTFKKEKITLEVDKEAAKEYLKKNIADWGKCFDKKYLVIRTGKKTTEEEENGK